MIEWSISIGSILAAAVSLIGFMGTIIGMFYALRVNSTVHEVHLTHLGGRMINIENEVKELKNVLITLAAQDQRITAMNGWMHGIEERFEERFVRMERELDRVEQHAQRG